MKALVVLLISCLLFGMGILPVFACVRQTAVKTEAAEAQGLFFFGESTTAHLSRKGGVLDTKEGRRHVLRDESGTRMLDRRILSSSVLLHDASGNSKKVTFTEAITELKPPVLILSFGLNGITSSLKDIDRFLDHYTMLLDGIQKASPTTRIVLQSIYPVASSDAYTLELDALNEGICTLNRAIECLAKEQGVCYADTASLLKDSDGRLCPIYDNGDGIHLTNLAYERILSSLKDMV